MISSLNGESGSSVLLTMPIRTAKATVPCALFTSAYNEMYVKDISAKIRRTLAYKREQGQFIGSFAPYGYAIDPKDKHHLVIDAETAPVVKQIFSMYIEGNGYRKIVQDTE